MIITDNYASYLYKQENITVCIALYKVWDLDDSSTVFVTFQAPVSPFLLPEEEEEEDDEDDDYESRSWRR